MTDFALGTRVVIHDYLRRVRIDRGRWYERDGIVPEFLTEGGVIIEGVFPTKLWIPESLHAKVFAALGFWTRPDNRHHPTVSGIAMPTTGVVVQKITLQDGGPDNDPDWGSSWIPVSHREGYKVAYNLRRRPLIVWPTMITPEEEQCPSSK